MLKTAFVAATAVLGGICSAQNLLNSELVYTAVIQGLTSPVAFEFIDESTILVTEKTSGKVKRYVNGVYAGDALTLTIINTGEMGLLGICKDPDFVSNQFVYIFYSRADQGTGAWLDDRLVRYTWNGTNLVSPQAIWVMGPTAQFPDPVMWHHGGYIRFGPDDKLYLQRGDMLRFGCMEMNNTPTTIGVSASVYRINTDGSAPPDNPFFGHANEHVEKIWVYGFRNGFGMDWDRSSGKLWFSENGPEVYDEVNVARPGMNSGWRLIMGPDSRNATYVNNNNTAYNANQLYYLPGATYHDPVFSYLAPIGIAGLGFFKGTRFLETPSVYDNVLTGNTNTGRIYMMPVAANRESVIATGGLADLVADTALERDEWSLGTGWGSITDIRTGPDGYLYASSYNLGRVFRIMPKNDVAVPSSGQIIRGDVASGNTGGSLFYSDDSRLVIRPGIVLSPSQSPIVFELTGTSAYATPSQFNLVVESSASSSSIQQVVEAWDYIDDRFEVVDTRNLTTVDQKLTITPPAPFANYIQAGTRQMRMRVSFRAVAPVLALPWQARVDMVHWTSRLP